MFAMKTRQFVWALFLCVVGRICSSGNSEEHQQATFYIQNKCPFPIWPAIAPNAGQPVLADGGFYISSGSTKGVWAPLTWNGRIWARTGCKFGSNWQSCCETGDCDGRLACNGLNGTPPATLVEVVLQAGRPSSYDVSLVDGYNLPVSVQSSSAQPKCTISGCVKDMNRLCPAELQVVNGRGDVVACKSACLEFGADQFCCTNNYRTADKCKASVYSNIFKDACPSYYSYAYDSPSPAKSCASQELVITFCPSGWGIEQLQEANRTTTTT